LPNDVIEKLFEFLFTGGEGEQEGDPGKEWTTITVRPVPAPRSIYERFDPNRYRDPKLQQTFGGTRQPVISETRGNSLQETRRGSERGGRRDQQMRMPTTQPATFQPSIAALHIPQIVNPLRPAVLGQAPAPQTIVIPGLPQANPRFLDRRAIEDIVDGVQEAFLEGNYDIADYNQGNATPSDRVRYFTKEIERLAIAEGGADKAVFDRERAFADAYLRRAALRRRIL
jgi:hypothetical protein